MNESFCTQLRGHSQCAAELIVAGADIDLAAADGLGARGLALKHRRSEILAVFGPHPSKPPATVRVQC